MVYASEGDHCYHLHKAPRPMTDPKNTKDKELSLDQLKEAAGGLAQANQAPSLSGKTLPLDEDGPKDGILQQAGASM